MEPREPNNRVKPAPKNKPTLPESSFVSGKIFKPKRNTPKNVAPINPPKARKLERRTAAERYFLFRITTPQIKIRMGMINENQPIVALIRKSEMYAPKIPSKLSAVPGCVAISGFCVKTLKKSVKRYCNAALS